VAKNDNLLLYGGLAALGVFILSTPEKAALPHVITPSGDNLTPSQFVKKYYPYALDSQKVTKVPALVTLAQAGLESAYGKHAYGNNFFGIKAGSSWNGEIQKLKTWECGKTSDEVIKMYAPYSEGSNPNCNAAGKTSYRVYGKFRAYPNAQSGFVDHGEFLRDNKRYKAAFKYTEPSQFAVEIAKAGYATAPNYATILVQTIINIKKVLAAGGGSW